MGHKFLLILVSFCASFIPEVLWPLELVSLRDYTLHDTLLSSTFVNEEWIWLCMLAWWRRLSVAREVCFGLLCRWNLVQMAASLRMRIGICWCACTRRNFTIISPSTFTADTRKNCRFGWRSKLFKLFFPELELAISCQSRAMMSHDF